ncbi:NFX1-type zinc finger-containing protein 1-like [Ruditapes philippinarum]|uniref:NFX1-type zinc finger-containing protein 1-like n=1 Tax=Ruditapes philippinarum TaxID=129788 RepID=UPI00295BAAC3|nr:NFX1-type zinc finger-containing protein 1-like [Ruditapes philippinarum]
MEETEFISKSVTMLKLFFETTQLMEDYSNNLDVVCTLIRIVTRVCTLSQCSKTFIFACKADISEMIDVIKISVQDRQRPGDLENAAPTEGTPDISENLNNDESERSSLVDECIDATSDMLSDISNDVDSLSNSSGDSECKRRETLIETTRIQLIQTYLKYIKQLFKELEHAVQGSTIRSRKQLQELNNSDNGSDENFREIPIFPRIGDLNGDIKPRLRINKAKGGYESIDDYLDVQFRLLREDFVEPLREGIREFKYRKIQNSNVKLKDIKVYGNTQIISPVCGNGVNYILSFDVSNLGHVRWNISKRLKYGSLVCLTADNFETCFFAVIVDSNTRYRRKGRVHVKFFKSPEEDQFLQGATFTMIESTAYFEAYRPVLSSLQTIMDTNFPFQKYIIKCQNETSPPKYLLRKSCEITMDLQCLLRSQFKFGNDGFLNYNESTTDVKILEQEWPIDNQIPLDASQLNALKSALTRDFTLIQGPPGCGKTHIGLLIAKALLFNRRKWQQEYGMRSQMLIICYTNHALDQFMEGICSFYTGNIVRVGGRSRNEALDKFNLKCIKQKYRENKIIPTFIQRGRANALGDVIPLKRKLNLKSEKIRLLKENIVHENFLYSYMNEKHRKQFERFSRYYKSSPLPWLAFLGKSCIVEWLGIITTAKEVQKNIYLDHHKAKDIMLDKRIDDLFWEENREAMVDMTFDETNLFDDDDKKELNNFRRHELSLDFDQVKNIDLASCNHRKRKIIALERKMLIKHLKNKLQTVKPFTNSEALSVKDIMCKDFSEEKRWALYLFWVHCKCNQIQQTMDKDPWENLQTSVTRQKESKDEKNCLY